MPLAIFGFDELLHTTSLLLVTECITLQNSGATCKLFATVVAVKCGVGGGHYFIPSPFYEARFGVEIFVELYDSTLSSPVSSYMLKRYMCTFYFIDFTVIVYCYYGYLPILQHIWFQFVAY